MDFKAFQLVTSEEIATLLKMERHTISEWAKRGMIPGIKLGKIWRFDVKEVFDYLKEIRTLEPIYEQCEHNGYTIHNVCNGCGKFLNKEESDRCCSGG